MIDNISYNFEHFEYNGLSINEYWGHLNNNQLYKLIDIINGSVISSSSNDIRNNYIHRHINMILVHLN